MRTIWIAMAVWFLALILLSFPSPPDSVLSPVKGLLGLMVLSSITGVVTLQTRSFAANTATFLIRLTKVSVILSFIVTLFNTALVLEPGNSTSVVMYHFLPLGIIGFPVLAALVTALWHVTATPKR